MSAPEFELPRVELPFAVGSMDPTVVHDDPGAGGITDGGILIMPAAGADAHPTFVPQALLDADAKLASALLNLVPMIGTVKGSIEAFTGDDMITGDHLAWWERALDVAAIVPTSELEGAVETGALAHALLDMTEVLQKVQLVTNTISAGQALGGVETQGEEARHLQPPGE